MSVPDCITVVIGAGKDIVLAGAAVFTASAAVRGLNKWSDELRGKADFEAGRALAKATQD